MEDATSLAPEHRQRAAVPGFPRMARPLLIAPPMTTFSGNSSVQGGYYLSTRSFAIEAIGNEGGTLPGPSSVEYVAVPFPALFLVAPIIGLAFLMSTPAIGFAHAARFFSRRSLRQVTISAEVDPVG
jgi:hypothetical protein